MSAPKPTLYFRWLLPILGGLYGLCFYLLADDWPSDWNDRTWLFLVMFLGVFGTSGLMFAVPLGLWRAAMVSACLAGLNACLMLWASFGFDRIDDDLFLLTGRAWIATVLVPMPFVLAFMQTPNRLWDYDYLYRTAWGLFARYVLAGIFSGIGIGILFGFAAALKLVGIYLLEDILDTSEALFFIWGALFGLGVAVLYELEDIVTSILRLIEFLLRAFLPVVVVFSTIFLVALFVNLGEVDSPRRLLFGGSIATFYGAMLLGGVVFLTAACSIAGKETDNKTMVWMCRAMAVNSGILAVLVLWAAAQRVEQYGWTPDRLMLVVFGLLGLVYGLGYLSALFWRRDWWVKLRQVNVVAALFTVLAGILWLTPLLDANRISANSQEARVLAQAEGAQNAEWSLKRWGRAGSASLERLQNDPEAVAFLKTANRSTTSNTTGYLLDVLNYVSGEDFIRSEAQDPDSQFARLLTSSCPSFQARQLNCYVMLRDVAPNFSDDEILIFSFRNLHNPAYIESNVRMLHRLDDGWKVQSLLHVYGELSESEIFLLFEQVQRGDVTFVDVQTPALKVGDKAYQINIGPIELE